MRNNNLTQEEIKTIASLGFSVYMGTNPNFQTYCYYSDGKRIGYLEHNDLKGFCICAVHIPNVRTGTGFSAKEFASLTREDLEMGFMTAPGWASSAEVASVRKYASLQDFLARHKSELVQVAGATQCQ